MTHNNNQTTNNVVNRNSPRTSMSAGCRIGQNHFHFDFSTKNKIIVKFSIDVVPNLYLTSL